ncbi:2-polyprenyl-3-methyl-5-hydroxy-6-metoxy-1,4-benzoquinol methylase [Kribbella aluminosa]|uniref:2-polyprenyl-3-methyl-5-hydroxy-6-metoxy-1, 4-benzoquinol methylase n=1 Tax=Kribbella aluminosa TaxID=416017 RepID=A0ABS4UR19_9ACTN|nr:class I SAM-dependent methyltransferase [Kribbella aluminosa]MBP2354092.1 2-polyprenyl-3-methyl-5-hydroxy-6-metoxy-1,4-benzoquinol methylase [Kribbella aluminosa]
MGERWNHNIHYHPRILHAVPYGAERALDIGCGEGMLTRALRDVVPEVTGIDLDTPSLELARGYGDDIEYLHGDFLEYPLEQYDVIASVATLHHVDARTGLLRMCDLLRPGGVMVVVGVARAVLPRDLPYELAGVAANWAHRAVKSYWQHPSPVVWPPPVTFAEMRALTGELLPGATYRRHLLFRYSITWKKPT